MSTNCGDVLSLEDLQIAKKNQVFEAEVITGLQGGKAGGASIDYAINQNTGQVQKTLPAVLRDSGFRSASFTFATGGALGVNDADLAVMWPGPSGNGLYYSWHGALPKTIPAASSPSSTGGESDTAWKLVGDLGLRHDLALTSGGSLIGLKRNLFSDILPTTVAAFYQSSHINVCTDYGLVPDFDPSTGVANGTNNRINFQKLLDNLVTLNGAPAVVFIPPGRYFFNGASPEVSAFGGCLAFGKVATGFKNVTFIGYGAEFYFGSKGRHIIIMNGKDVKLLGLKVIGYAGGTASASDENNACISINYNSHRITIEDCYLCNSPGDQIYLGGSLVSGGQTGFACRDIKIINCTLKERYGNGIRSFDASGTGTRSRLALAVIDCIGLDVSNNLIVGQIDLEPNLSGQTIQHAHIHDNNVRVGSVAGELTNGFREEPMYSGTSVMRGGIMFTSPELPALTNVVVENNLYEYGNHNLKLLSDMKGITISNEHFERGCIIIGDPSGPNYYSGVTLLNNRVHLPLNGQDDDVFWTGTPPTVPACMFWIRGNMAYFTFSGNNAGDATGGIDRMFFSQPSAAGDAGRCVYANNTCIVASTFRNFEINSSSVEIGSVAMKTSGTSVSVNNLTNTKARQVTPIGATITAGALNWDNYKTSNLLVNSASAISVTSITGGLGNGTELELKLSGGSANVTLVHSASFSLKGATNALLDSPAKVIMLRQVDSAGNWLEIYRNF